MTLEQLAGKVLVVLFCRMILLWQCRFLEEQLSLSPLITISFGPGKLVSVYITLVSR